MGTIRELIRGGVRLAYHDFGGDGPSVLLLHGLAGHGDEWRQTASWLTARSRVVAPDARGHGRSDRFVSDVSRDAAVGDAAFVIEQLNLGPVVAVGQSIGGLTALSLAARRPELVRALVVVEASPDGGGPEVEAEAAAIGDALRTWPVPFGSRAEAEAFFADRFGGDVAADAWTRGLERRGGGWRPRFDIEVMVQTLRQAIEQASWDEWERIACPTLVVRAGDGVVEPGIADEMIRRQAGARLIVLEGASHDLHLDRPDEWRTTLTGVLDGL